MDILGSFRKFKTTFGNILRDVPPRIARQVLRRLSKDDATVFKKTRRKTEPQASSKSTTNGNFRNNQSYQSGKGKQRKFPSTQEPMTRCRCRRKSSSAVIHRYDDPVTVQSRNRKITLVPGSNLCSTNLSASSPSHKISCNHIIDNCTCTKGTTEDSNNDAHVSQEQKPTHKNSGNKKLNRFTSEVFEFSKFLSWNSERPDIGRDGMPQIEEASIGQGDHEDQAAALRDDQQQITSSHQNQRSVVVESEIPYLINTSDDTKADTIFIYHVKVQYDFILKENCVVVI